MTPMSQLASSTVNYEYPTTRELIEINPEKIVNITRNRPTFRFFPTTEDNRAWRIEWTQRDNYRGFQQLRGLNGEPSYVKQVGAKRFSAEPGVYGEYMTLDEKELTMRASVYNPGEPVDITDLVTEKQDILNAREIDLIEFLHWSVLLNGTFAILGPTGAYYTDTFPIQTITFSDWSDLVNATPLADLRNLALLAEGKSVDFGPRATMFTNSVTFSYLANNRNPADMGGVKMEYGRSVLGTADVNKIFVAQDLPQVEIYNEGYNRESDGAFVKWIANDIISIIGARTNGDRLGEYRMVRNVNNPGSRAGRYEEVFDNLGKDVPRKIAVHRGHNGGMVVYYGSAIIRANA